MVNRNVDPDYHSESEDEEWSDMTRTVSFQLTRLWIAFSGAFNRIMTKYQIYDLIDCIALKIAEHPFISLGVSGIIVAFFLSLLLCAVFALSTAVMTLTGFVVIGTIMIFSLICSLFLLCSFLGAIFLAGYFGFKKVNAVFGFYQSNQRIEN